MADGDGSHQARRSAETPSAAARRGTSESLGAASPHEASRDDSPDCSALLQFSPLVRRWFLEQFNAPTLAQEQAWDAISQEQNSLVIAPTGSGKTLAAFLWAIDQLVRSRTASDAIGTMKNLLPSPHASPVGLAPANIEATQVLYISPLKALGVDVHKNLQVPLAGIKGEYRALGLVEPQISVGVRSGDTSAYERRKLRKHPPDILITTPESLYLMLTSGAAETLTAVRTVIVDEVHALAATKRGAHLAVSLERLDDLVLATSGSKPVTRIGLSATVKPASEVARFLGGSHAVHIIEPPANKGIDVRVAVPFKDMSHPEVENLALGVGAAGEANPTDDHRIGSTWPAIEHAIYERVMQAPSTIIFANYRGQTERLTAALNDIHAASGGTGEIARAHHGSVSKEVRLEVEQALKAGELRCVVATASLELGIDMGAVKQVIQVDSPPSVAAGLQRIGRAGHRVGEVSRAFFYPVHRSQLPEIATLVQRIESKSIESTSVIANPLDILAQQTVAAVSQKALNAQAWFDTVRRSAPFATLNRADFDSVLDLLSGKYPSTEFSEMRPRISWNRETGVLTARPGARQLAIMNGGTIPDRGLYRVEIARESESAPTTESLPGRLGTSPKIGELDEEMVFESRVGDVIVLGTSSWRIREITPDRVKVVPAPGQRGRVPFWHGEGLGRPAELGWAIGATVRECLTQTQQNDSIPKQILAGLDPNAAANTLAYLAEAQETAGAVPTDRDFVVERTRDELGDYQILLQTPLGKAVHSPWALAVGARLRERFGSSFQIMSSNDGIVIRFADVEGEPPGAELFVFDPAEMAEIVQQEVSGSALFAARFRECAGRALLLGAGSPHKRAPLWQQRHRAARLLEVAATYTDFPIVKEAARECLHDVYDLPTLIDTCQRIAFQQIRLHEVTTASPSTYARSMLFESVGEFIYQGDTPAAERKLAALSFDTELMEQLLGTAGTQDVFDPDVIREVEAELQHTATTRQVHGSEGVADLLRILGPLTVSEIFARSDVSAADIADLLRQERAVVTILGGGNYIAAAEDAGTLAAIGAVPSPELALSLGAPSAQDLTSQTKHFPARQEPLRGLISRYLHSIGPTSIAQIEDRFGVNHGLVLDALTHLEKAGSVRRSQFGGVAERWCDRDVVQRIKRRAAKRARQAITPATSPQFARFLLQWQYGGGQLTGVDGVLSVVEQLCGLPLVASTIESLILPQRVADYSPALLDSLVAAGEVVWVGEGHYGDVEGRVSLHLRETLSSTLRPRNSDVQSSVRDKTGPAQRYVTAAEGQTNSPESQPEGVVGHAPSPDELPLSSWIVQQLNGGRAEFGRDLLAQAQKAFPGLDPSSFADEMWRLAWEGTLTSDSLGALRAAIAPNAAQKVRRPQPRRRTLRNAALAGVSPRSVDARIAGRWSLVSAEGGSESQWYSTALALLLDRYGVVSRGVAIAESFPGGFSAVYEGLNQLEEAGLCRRGHFVEGVGGAQFATAAAVDQLRSFRGESESKAAASALDDSATQPTQGSDRLEPSSSSLPQPRTAVVLSATDPANPYGAILAWPELRLNARPRRNPGALVVLLGGTPVLYLERGGKTALTFNDDEITREERSAAAAELVRTCRRGNLSDFVIEAIDGALPSNSPWHLPMREAGLDRTPRGLSYMRPAR